MGRSGGGVVGVWRYGVVGMGLQPESDGGCRVKNNCYICEENACIQN